MMFTFGLKLILFTAFAVNFNLNGVVTELEHKAEWNLWFK